MKQGSFIKPMIVTYSYSWMCFFKMYATIIVRFKTEYINAPIMVSNDEIIEIDMNQQNKYVVRESTDCGCKVYNVVNTKTGNRINYYPDYKSAKEFAERQNHYSLKGANYDTHH